MPELKQKRSLRKWLGLKRVLALNVFVFSMIAWGFYGEALRNDEMQAEIDRLESQSQELAAKNSELAEFGKRLTDPQLLEKEARMKLNMRKPGEEVVVVRAATTVATTEGTTDASGADEGGEGSNLDKWWNYFFQ